MSDFKNNDIRIGKPAIRFFVRYRDYLINQTILHGVVLDEQAIKKMKPNATDTEVQKDNLSGGDIPCYILTLGSDADVLIPSYITEDTEERVIQGKTLVALEAAIEVKGHSWGQFLTRNNDKSSPYGTIGFELWESSGPGWIQVIFDPKMRNVQCETRTKNGISKTFGVQPFGIVNMYMCPTAGNTSAKYHACIAFTDMEKLKARLLELKDDDWDFYNWKATIPQGKTTDEPEPLKNGKSMLIGRQWHIPFELLSDIATVTIIDDDPPYIAYRSEKFGRVSEELFNQRLQYLKRCANGRHIDTNTVEPCSTTGFKQIALVTSLGERPDCPGDEIVLHDLDFSSARQPYDEFSDYDY